MARKVPGQLGLVAMIVLLVAVVALLPMVVRMLVRSVAGFEDSPASVAAPPSVPATMGVGNELSRYVPDANTNYICRSPHDSGVPCPEGEFCDGTTQSCQKKTVSAMGEISGYFS